MAFNKEKIQLFWIPLIGLTAPKANWDRHCGERCENNSRSEYSRTDICCEFSCVSMDAVSPNFRLFFASGNAPGSSASLLTRTAFQHRFLQIFEEYFDNGWADYINTVRQIAKLWFLSRRKHWQLLLLPWGVMTEYMIHCTFPRHSNLRLWKRKRIFT